MADASNEWLIEESAYSPDRELYWETVFALSNGYMATRGTLDENHFCPHVRSYYGTYVAGIFDKYNADYQAIVNLADFFNLVVYINDEQLDLARGTIENYRRHLDMHNGILVRQFVWTTTRGHKTQFEITRFISKSNPHLAVQHYRIKPLNYSGACKFTNVLDGNVANIDFHVSGYQLRDEKYFFIADEFDGDSLSNGGFLTLRTKTSLHRICELFRFAVDAANENVTPEVSSHVGPRCVTSDASFGVEQGTEYSFFKVIAVYTSNDGVDDLRQAAEAEADGAMQAGYARLLAKHVEEWKKAWQTSDIRIVGNERDQRNVRFNIYHLIQMGNKNNPRVNIGSRGLTSEMHYGNCFWDTELFILPFFIYTDPPTARALVQYRYETLPEARNKAKSQWLKGAMFPWMSSFPGREQADYWEYANIAVHIVSDVAYGLMHYHEATGDEEFMLDFGLELLIETARFWASRVDYSEKKKAYTINVVKGPNEYGIVSNNTYTNWGARKNIQAALRMLDWAQERHPATLMMLSERIRFALSETDEWRRIVDAMYINYDPERDLYIEDDVIEDKSPVDLKKLKPGKKITTELGHPWDMLLRLRIVKQADVLLLMYLNREDFTLQQLRNAWDFYEPITLHDSSLSYNTHSIIAAELGYAEKSEEYFQQTARLDLEDVMENVFLGIHSANAGGAWQCVINGFAGMRRHGNRLEFSPRLPRSWEELEFKVYFRDNLFRIGIRGDEVRIESDTDLKSGCRIEGNAIVMQKGTEPCS